MLLSAIFLIIAFIASKFVMRNKKSFLYRMSFFAVSFVAMFMGILNLLLIFNL